MPLVGQPSADGLPHARNDLLDFCLRLVLGRVEGLRTLAAVAVDRYRLGAQAPRLDVRLHDLFDSRFFRYVDGLGDRPGDERLCRAHHPDVAEIVNRALTLARLERTVEDREVLFLELRRA